MALKYLLLVFVFCVPPCHCMTKKQRSEMRETVKEMFLHAYSSYLTYAYPADELMPLSCKGRYRGSEPSRGDVDDILGNFSMTLIDSLDSLVIFGEIYKFEQAVEYVINEVQFANDIVVSTFETNIRILGGLLGGHVAANVLKNDGLAMKWYNDELLDMAKDIGERLMPAFNTTTGIPYPKVNLKYGVSDPRSRTGHESATCTACAGTMIMEFGALSRLTGDPKFETAAHRAMKALWTYRSRSSDLVGTVINIHNGEWVRRDSGVGAGIDSYYEYCLKAYILLGEEDYLQRFNQHYKAVMRYINKDSLFLNVHMNNPSKRSVSYMDSLQAFWPGLQVLKGDLQSAIELHEVFYSVAKRHTFLPEAFTTSFEVHWGQHFLRPELVESTYFLYEATKDPYYLEVGKYIVENLNRYTRVPCGFAAVKDVRTLSHENRMDSFLLSETLKYLYLLFTDKADLPIKLHDFVFTTEAHILPLALSNWNGSSTESNVHESENLHDHSCPRSAKDDTMMSFAEKIRQRTRQSEAGGSCPRAKEEQAFVKSKGAPPLLRAEQFIPGNKDHQQILKAMGISVAKTDDGKVQLMQDVTSADNSEMAAQGVTFMQSMIELAKFRSNDAEYLPRVVQILSPPYNGNIVLNAGPAQFGIDLGKSGMGVSAEVMLADPFNGCTDLKNKEAADHRIVVMERGDCMFIDKARVAESLGAVGAIIIDNNEGSSSESQPMFAMSGDGSSNNINIPVVFLFHNEGQVLQKSMQIVRINTGENLRVRLADKAVKKENDFFPSGKDDRERKTSEQNLEQKKLNEPPSEPTKSGESGKIEVNKLIDVLKNVMKQPGFEFLSKNTEAAVLMEEMDTADKRERWLYDAMMKNWRGRSEAGKSRSVDEVLEKLQDGFFSLKLGKLGDSRGQSNVKHQTGDCQAEKTREKFVNTVVKHSNRKVGEIFVVGNVGDGKLADMNVVVTKLQSDDGGSKGEGELKKHVDEMIVYSLDGSMTLNDPLNEDYNNKDGASRGNTYDQDGRSDHEQGRDSDISSNEHDRSDVSRYCNLEKNFKKCQSRISKNSKSIVRGDGLMNGKNDEEKVLFSENIVGSTGDESTWNSDKYATKKSGNTNVNAIKNSAQVQSISAFNQEHNNPLNDDSGDDNHDGENPHFTTKSNENVLGRESTIESAEEDNERRFGSVADELIERRSEESIAKSDDGGHEAESQDMFGHETDKESYIEIEKQEAISENIKLFSQEERESDSMNTNKISAQNTESDFERHKNLDGRTSSEGQSEVSIHDSIVEEDLSNQNYLDNDKESLEIRDVTDEESTQD